MMASMITRVNGYATLIWFASARWHHLGNAELRLQLHRQIHEVGTSAMPVVAALAVLTGVMVMSQVMALGAADNAAVQKWLFFGLFFELAPLICALVVTARGSATMASELAVMHLNDEFTALRRMGIAPADYVLLPRIFAMVLALPVVTVFFQIIAVGSGWLAVALLQGHAAFQAAGYFLEMASPVLALVSLFKSAVMGGLVGVIACHHGSSGARSAQAVSDVTIHAVGNSLVAVFAADLAFAFFVYLLK